MFYCTITSDERPSDGGGAAGGEEKRLVEDWFISGSQGFAFSIIIASNL